jgi:hypothetical protein
MFSSVRVVLLYVEATSRTRMEKSVSVFLRVDGRNQYVRVRESPHTDWDTGYDVVRDKAATRAEPGRQGNKGGFARKAPSPVE